MSIKYWRVCAVLFVVAVSLAIQQGIQARSSPPPDDVCSLSPAASSTLSYPIVDTGQTACYDDDGPAIACPTEGQAFYGQDAQSDGNQPSYTLRADGLTVYDNVTGLTWTQSPDLDGDGDINLDDKLSFTEAQAYPDTLNAQNYGGYSDWRLPTIKELYSLMDFRGTDPSGPDPSSLTPFIDTDYFAFAYGDTDAGERLIDAQFWSSNAYVGSVFGNQSAAFGLNLADGRIKGYPSSTDGPITKLNYVYFVRGNTDYGVNDFTDNGDGTVTDDATGLMWSQDDSGDGVNTGPRSGMTWEDALAWVEQKNDENYLGHDDWRLPNAKEMQSILDYSRAPDATNSAAIDPIFNITRIANENGEVDYPWFWTSTTHARADGSGRAGVYICFGRAMGYMNDSWLDVHGAGAQRSDQKGGDFTGYTYEPDGYYFAQSPQGDAVRIYNYVRLVRDADTTTPDMPYKVYLPFITRGGGEDNAAFTIEQTLSDEAQRNTIAFDALAFLTGNLGADSFFPPGKVADFWGFQYLRDNDPTEMGHNTDFLTRAALNMLTVLTPAQRAKLIALAESQVDAINQYAYDRFVLMDAFRRLLAGDLPAGSPGLDEDVVRAYSADLYRLDGEISYDRAHVMGGILSELDGSQRAYLDAMVGQGMLDWPDVEEPSDVRGLDRDVKVAVMTYAGDMFSWYAGSVEADVYFCPERQGTYFGSFYLKDAPAMGNPDYTIPSNLTGDMGRALLETLTADQAQLVTGLVGVQKPHLLGIVDVRREVSTELRRFMAGQVGDRAAVLSLMEEYGELDGAIVYNFAQNFSQVNQTLTAEQKVQLMALRTEMLGDMLVPPGAYLYSQPIAMPEIPNSDFLFAVP